MDAPTWDSTTPLEQPVATGSADSAVQPQQANPIPGQAPAEPTWDSTVDKSEYETPGQILKTAAEGAAEGVLGPLAPLIEKHVLGVKPEDMLARREINPVTHGGAQALGLGASLFTGVGEGALLAKAGLAAKEAIGLGKAAEGLGLGAKIGAEALDQAAQAALFQGGDEISKMIINDPNATAQNAIANVGLSAALGGATGAAIGAISPLWKAAGVGDKIGKTIEDFKARANFRSQNPDIVAAAGKEFQDLHSNISNVKDALFSAGETGGGIRGDAIAKALPEVTPQTSFKIQGELQDVSDTMSKQIRAMSKDPVLASKAKVLERDLVKFQEAALNPEASYADHFNAINDLKKQMQGYSKYGMNVEDSEFGAITKKIAAELRPTLENPKVWGEAANIQKDINAAFSQYLPTEKDITSKFTSALAGDRVIDSNKINTYMNQLGSTKAELKQEVVKNYLEKSQDLIDKVNKTFLDRGLEAPFNHTSTNVLSDSIGQKTQGAKLYDMLIEKELDKVAGKSLSAGVGGTLGTAVGQPVLGAMLGEAVLGSTAHSVMSGLAKFLVENPTSANAFKSASTFLTQAAKGQTLLNKAVGSIFDPTIKVGTAMAISQADRDKLDRTISKLSDTPGKVQNIDNGQIAHYMPQHQSSLTETTVTAGKYLNDLKPKPYRSSPLDAEIKPSDMEIQRYNRALDIAQQPAIVLQHVKDGTLQPSDIQDLHSMYPALYQQMSNQLTQQLTVAQAKNQQLPYRTKIGISLFLGQPLDSSMTPSSIVAAQPQAGNAPQTGPAQQPKGQGKSMKSLGKTNKTYLTQSQGAEADRAQHRDD